MTRIAIILIALIGLSASKCETNVNQPAPDTTKEKPTNGS